MTQTIEQLQARVAELEAAIEAWSEGQKEDIQLQVDLHQQLLSAQADIKRLRDALEWARSGFFQAASGFQSQRHLEEHWGICDQALSQPSDTSALDAYVAEKVKEAHKVVPREGLVPHAYQLEATHNNAEFWYRAGHSEEARAKGESVICMAQAVFAWRNAAYAKAEEVSELTRQRDLAVDAILWACGEKPNADGEWFDAPENAPKYWWRSELRKGISTIKESEARNVPE